MSLPTKILLSICAVMVVVLLLVTLNLVLEAASDSQKEMFRHSDLVSLLVADWVAGEKALQEGTDWNEVSRKLARSQLVSDWLIAGEEGGLLRGYCSSEPGIEAAVQREREALAMALEQSRAFSRGERVYTRIERVRGAPVAARFTLRPPALPRRDRSGGLVGILWIMGLGTLLLLLVIYMLMRRLVLRPIASLVEASGRVARGDFGTPIPGGAGYDETARMIQAFNLMMGQIAEHHRTMRQEIEEATGQIRETEKRLFAAQRLSTTGTLAAGIAHEVNNPIGGMLNAVRVVRRGEIDAGKREEYLNLIEEGIQRIRDVVAQVLQFTPRSLQASPVSLRTAVDRAAAFLEHQTRARRIEVLNEIPVGLPPVSGDALELQQAVLNLLINACDAVEEGHGRIRIGGVEEGGMVRLSISDNGCGMNETQLQRCLDPFYTTKEVGRGTGLGLPVANNIVSNHGGRLELRSVPGGGTTVEIVLPILQDSAAAKPSLGTSPTVV